MVVKSVDQSLRIKIADFNVAKKYNDKQMMTKTGMDDWLAPEII
jgi:hypothetical protein